MKSLTFSCIVLGLIGIYGQVLAADDKIQINKDLLNKSKRQLIVQPQNSQMNKPVVANGYPKLNNPGLSNAGKVNTLNEARNTAQIQDQNLKTLPGMPAHQPSGNNPGQFDLRRKGSGNNLDARLGAQRNRNQNDRGWDNARRNMMPTPTSPNNDQVQKPAAGNGNRGLIPSANPGSWMSGSTSTKDGGNEHVITRTHSSSAQDGTHTDTTEDVEVDRSITTHSTTYRPDGGKIMTETREDHDTTTTTIHSVDKFGNGQGNMTFTFHGGGGADVSSSVDQEIRGGRVVYSRPAINQSQTLDTSNSDGNWSQYDHSKKAGAPNVTKVNPGKQPQTGGFVPKINMGKKLVTNPDPNATQANQAGVGKIGNARQAVKNIGPGGMPDPRDPE